MSLLLIDYTNLVLKAYEEGRETSQLSQLLMHPTAASIKQECINVYTERLERGEMVEENTLRAFFGVPPAGKNFGDLIEWCRLGKFKSIQKLIRKQVKIPSSANVELLAWLIDFKPRPLSRAERILVNVHDTIIAGGQGTGTNQPSVVKDPLHIEPDTIQDGDNKNPGDPALKNSSASSQNRRLKIVAVVSLAIAILFGGMYVINKSYGGTNTGCMYWASDHYEKVPCNEDPKGRLIIALDEERMNNFHMITRADTITERSIGMIYYLKTSGKIEYFTAAGKHPVYVTRTLKVLSVYMFDNYLRKKELPGKDSLAEQNIKSITNR